MSIIRLKNLPLGTKASDVIACFGKLEVGFIKIVGDNDAFVELQSSEKADLAMKLDGMFFHENKIHLCRSSWEEMLEAEAQIAKASVSVEAQCSTSCSSGEVVKRKRIMTGRYMEYKMNEDDLTIKRKKTKNQMVLASENVSKIVTDQRNFFKNGNSRAVAFRKEQLKKMREMIVQYKDKICEAVYKDLRRNTETTMQMEVDGSLQSVDFCLSELDDWVKPQKLENHQLGQPLVIFEPKGVVLVITAWNYPFTLAIQPVADAIAAGNTVVIKPSEVSPNTSKLLSEMFDANFDKKVVAVVEGAAPETHKLLEQRFDHIFYTGSSSIAKSVMKAAAKNLTPVTLELGGKCPVVVENDADVEKAAQRIAEGKWLNCGQTCLAPDYIMTTVEMKPKLVDALQKSIRTLYGDNPKNSEQYSRMVNQRHFDRVKAMLDKTSGKVLYRNGEVDREDVYIPPVVVETDLKDALMNEEVFGPVLPIITVKGLDEAIEVINDGEKPLGAYLFTKDQQKVDKFLNNTSSGGVTINDVLKHVFVRDLPFGGVGNSGMGSYHGKHGFMQLSHAKAVLKRVD